MSSFLAAMDTSIVTTIFNQIGTEFKRYVCATNDDLRSVID